MSQLALPLKLADHAVFATFMATGNEALVAHLEGVADARDGHGAWVYGAAATGKSHLLQAVCERAGDRAIYVPLGDLAPAGPAVLDGLESLAVVCLDDLDAVAGRPDWEEAIFHLINALGSSGGQLVAAAPAAPRASGFGLPDLASRLSRLPVFRLQALNEPQRAAALKLRAQHRGLELPDETAKFLLARSRRDMASLYRLLDRLDGAALQAQRRLTIPFVRDVLKDDGP